MKICGIIPVFFPENNFFEYLAENSGHLDHIFLINNGFNGDLQGSVKSKDNSKITVINMSSNLGVANAFNRGIIEAIKQKYDWFLLLDQDSKIKWPLSDIYKYLICSPQKKEIYFLNYHQKDNISKTDFKSVKPRSCISSGSFLNKNIISDIGFMDDLLHIDLVDTEYGLRASQENYKLYMTNKQFLLHEIGKPIRKNFYFFTLGSSGHSEKRRFFKARNSIILFKKYFLKDPRTIIFLFDIFKLMALIILVENNKLLKIFFILKGVYWGIKGSALPYKLTKQVL